MQYIKHFLEKYLPFQGLRFVIIILLALGIFFRFVNIESKLYWHDEAYTSLRVSGYTKSEFVQQAFIGRVIPAQFLQKYQQTNPDKSVVNTINSLAVDDSQHPPLYYVMVRLWMQVFGNSVAATRSLSVIISLLAFPCLFWLCLELFGSPITAWISVALLTVSPFHVAYAQEARQFSLWTLIILLGGAVLLRAIRLNTKQLWIMYALTVGLGLYTFLFSGLVVLAHSVYILTIERFKLSKKIKAYFIATISGFLTFIPWLFVIIHNLSQVNETTTTAQARQSLSSLMQSWIQNISCLFGDFWRYEQYMPDLNFTALRWGRFLVPFLLILVIYSFIFVARKSQSRVWLFIFILSAVPAFAVIFPDVVIGGKLSARARYVIPCYVGIQLAVTYLLTHQTIFYQVKFQKFWQLVTVILISTGVISCTISSQAETWWNKGSYENVQIARVVNQSAKPLLISSTNSLNIGNVMSISHLLNPTVNLQLLLGNNLPQIPSEFSNVFVLNVSQEVKNAMEKDYKFVKIKKTDKLWRLEKNVI
ncbi:glycosyltransferase family 39 protein [Calothrix membranacea FACHB-236]|nr:glycosyltransferase family 39 protein [Calothrix membranacea FACHB-236]